VPTNQMECNANTGEGDEDSLGRSRSHDSDPNRCVVATPPD